MHRQHMSGENAFSGWIQQTPKTASTFVDLLSTKVLNSCTGRTSVFPGLHFEYNQTKARVIRTTSTIPHRYIEVLSLCECSLISNEIEVSHEPTPFLPSIFIPSNKPISRGDPKIVPVSLSNSRPAGRGLDFNENLTLSPLNTGVVENVSVKGKE